MKLVGTLPYLNETCPIIMYVISFIFKEMESLKITYWLVSKMMLTYVVGIKNYARSIGGIMVYGKCGTFNCLQFVYMLTGLL